MTTVDGSIYKAQFLVNSMGFLHKPNIPKFKNMDKFKGRMFHSAQWQHNFDYSGKKCAVIGSGCSGIQIVPELAKSASEVNMFQRSPSLILEKQGDGKNTVLMNFRDNLSILIWKLNFHNFRFFYSSLFPKNIFFLLCMI